jgi:hypothetical protein
MVEPIMSQTNAPKRDPEDARAAEIGHDGNVRGPMRYVLIISSLLAIAALAVAYFVFAA